MWLLIILTFVNASMGYKASLNQYRFSVGGLPINVVDVLMFVGLFMTPFWLRRASQQWGKHPLFAVAMVLCLLSLVGGTIMGVVAMAQSSIDARQLVTFTRNFAAIPIGILIGYSALIHYRSTRVFAYVAAFAGCITATLVLRFFLGRAQDFGIGSSLESLRTVDYVQMYAGSGACLLVASVLLGARMFPSLVALGMAGYCVVGHFSSLSRSDWIATMGSMMAIFTCLPRDKVALRAVQGVLALVVLAVSLGVGLEVASRATGRDFTEKMATRLRTLLPGYQEGVQQKAWATRTIGIQREIEEGLKSPLIGRGFGFQDSPEMADAAEGGARHNSWTNAFCETGLLGVTTAAVVVGGCIVVGRRIVKARTDAGTLLIGALGLVTATYYGLLGMMTGAFNGQRGGLHLGLTLGLVLRARMMQLTMVQQYAGYVDFAAGGGDDELPLAAAAVNGGADSYY